MENEFYRDDFELFLRDNTDDFKMYPSRKVWYSLYNNLHPDRKWPSLAVCLLLITAILYLGISNNNSINAKNKGLAVTAAESVANTSTNIAPNKMKPVKVLVNQSDAYTAEAKQNLALADNHSNSNVAIQSTTSKPSLLSRNDNGTYVTTSSIAENESSVEPNVIYKEPVTVISIVENRNNNTNLASETNEVKPADVSSLTTTPTIARPIAAGSLTDFMQQDREWIEDFAFYNKRRSKESRLYGWSSQFYVTPSIGYRVLFKNKSFRSAAQNALIANANRNNSALAEPNEQGALSIEAGASLMKTISKRIRLKTGIQFNYTDFITYAQKLDHPTATIIAVNGDYGVQMEPSVASYANTPGKNKTKLHNKAIQLSIPLGLDYKIVSGRKISWYAGASIQPTYITGGFAYAQSADNNFYVEDASLLRRWNMNTAVESFITIKAPGGSFIHLGPQFRYQLLSTYTKKYTYTEKPYNIGFKIGLSKPL